MEEGGGDNRKYVSCVSIYLHLSRLSAIEKNKAMQAEWMVFVCVFCYLFFPASKMLSLMSSLLLFLSLRLHGLKIQSLTAI